MHVSVLQALKDDWLRVPAARLGSVPTGEGTSDAYVLAETDAGERLRVDLYEDDEHLYVRTEAVAWVGWIAVGFGHGAYLVDPRSREVRSFALDGYFSAFHAADAYLLVASGESLMRVSPAGEVEWRLPDLAIDGISIESVADGVVSGRAEWDPPDGGRPFRVDVETGELLYLGPPPYN